MTGYTVTHIGRSTRQDGPDWTPKERAMDETVCEHETEWFAWAAREREAEAARPCRPDRRARRHRRAGEKCRWSPDEQQYIAEWL